MIRLGHDVGDQALQEMADPQTLAGPDDIITRYGGDEFVVLLHDTEENLACSRCGDRIEDEVAYSNRGQRKPVSLSVKYGIRNVRCCWFC